MLEYLKMLIVSIVTGLTAPLPTSSAAHFNFFANVVGFSADNPFTITRFETLATVDNSSSVKISTSHSSSVS